MSRPTVRPSLFSLQTRSLYHTLSENLLSLSQMVEKATLGILDLKGEILKLEEHVTLKFDTKNHLLYLRLKKPTGKCSDCQAGQPQEVWSPREREDTTN